MKNLKIMIALVMVSTLSVEAHEVVCKVEMIPLEKIYRGVCPRGSSVVGARLDHLRQINTTYVTCSKPVVTCTEQLEEEEESYE